MTSIEGSSRFQLESFPDPVKVETPIGFDPDAFIEAVANNGGKVGLPEVLVGITPLESDLKLAITNPDERLTTAMAAEMGLVTIEQLMIAQEITKEIFQDVAKQAKQAIEELRKKVEELQKSKSDEATTLRKAYKPSWKFRLACGVTLFTYVLAACASKAEATNTDEVSGNTEPVPALTVGAPAPTEITVDPTTEGNNLVLPTPPETYSPTFTATKPWETPSLIPNLTGTSTEISGATSTNTPESPPDPATSNPPETVAPPDTSTTEPTEVISPTIVLPNTDLPTQTITSTQETPALQDQKVITETLKGLTDPNGITYEPAFPSDNTKFPLCGKLVSRWLSTEDEQGIFRPTKVMEKTIINGPLTLSEVTGCFLNAEGHTTNPDEILNGYENKIVFYDKFGEPHVYRVIIGGPRTMEQESKTQLIIADIELNVIRKQSFDEFNLAVSNIFRNRQSTQITVQMYINDTLGTGESPLFDKLRKNSDIYQQISDAVLTGDNFPENLPTDFFIWLHTASLVNEFSSR